MGSNGLRTGAHRTTAFRTVLRSALPFLLGVVLTVSFLGRCRLPCCNTGQDLREHIPSLQSRASLDRRLQHDCCGDSHARQKLQQVDATATGVTDLPVYVAPNTTAATASQEGVFLFIGVLSAGQNLQRRLAVREAWVTDGQITNVSVVRFVLSKDEWTPQVQQEADSFHDIVFVEEKTSYDSLLYKSYFVLEHAVTAHSARFVLKTDDDAFVNVRPLIRQLRLLCESADCRNERLYIGQMARDAPVQLDPKHKWNNVAFYNHTGLKQYPNYMMGGGYVLSGDVATALVKLHHMISLKFTPIEDATIAVWLMAMDVRQVDHPRFHSWAVPCCFKQPRWSGGQPLSVRLQLTDETEASVCGGDPWLLLHKIDQPFKMTFVGRRFRECEAEAEDPNQVPLSIAADVDGDKVDMAGETASTSSV